VATVLVALGLLFHPVSAGGFEERPSVLQHTPWWGPIHVAIAAGFVLCALGTLLILVAGGSLTRRWGLALAWGAMTVGMIFFAGAVAWAGVVCSVLSWGRGVGSATGLYFLEPLIFANVPAFLWLGYAGLTIARAARAEVAAGG